MKNSGVTTRSIVPGLAGLLILCGCGSEMDAGEAIRNDDGAIVGGVVAPVGAWPTVVSILYDNAANPPWYCGGMLIGDRWVLTANHCIKKDLVASRYDVVVGRHDITSSAGQVVAVANIIPHPAYQTHAVSSSSGTLPSAPMNDVAILELATAVPGPYSRLVSPGRMSEIQVGDDVTILGWGRTSAGGSSSNLLRQATVDNLGRGASCDALSDYSGLSNSELCLGLLAGGKDSCQGDSGGPALVQRDNEWFLLGDVSWGDGCAKPNLPGIYAYLPDQLEWVRSQTPGTPAPSYLPSAQIITTSPISI